MALASSRTSLTEMRLPAGQKTHPPCTLSVPDMLQCLVVSWSDFREQLLQSAAVDAQWHTVVCKDVRDFVRSVFEMNPRLTIVDLPEPESPVYGELQKAAESTCGVNDSLLMVCGSCENSEEEIWARQLGVWAYLPEETDLSGLKHIFREARKALAKKSSAYVELNAYR